MTTKETLYSVEAENIRHNQIGGQTDGWSSEQAEDIGYMTPEQFDTYIHDSDLPSYEEAATTIAEARARLARPKGYDMLSDDEKLANWNVPADGEVIPSKPAKK